MTTSVPSEVSTDSQFRKLLLLHLKIISSNCKVHIPPFHDIKVSTDGWKEIKEMLRTEIK